MAMRYSGVLAVAAVVALLLASAHSQEEGTAQCENLEGLQQHVATLEQQMAVSNDQITTLQRQAVADSTALAELRDQLQAKSSRFDELGMQLSDLQSMLAQAQADLAKAEASNAEASAASSATAELQKENAALAERVKELEEAWTPVWLDQASLQVQTAAKAGADQGAELYGKAAAAASEYMIKARESPAIADAQDKAIAALESAKEFSRKLYAEFEPQADVVKTHVSQVHYELVQFTESKMSEVESLRPYSKRENVALLVTCMMASPVAALFFPLFLWCCCSSKKKKTAPVAAKKAPTAAPRGKGKATGGNAGLQATSTTPRNKSGASGSDAKSPVQHGEEGTLSVGKDKVKYGKAVKL